MHAPGAPSQRAQVTIARRDEAHIASLVDFTSFGLQGKLKFQAFLKALNLRQLPKKYSGVGTLGSGGGSTMVDAAAKCTLVDAAEVEGPAEGFWPAEVMEGISV